MKNSSKYNQVIYNVYASVKWNFVLDVTVLGTLKFHVSRLLTKNLNYIWKIILYKLARSVYQKLKKKVDVIILLACNVYIYKNIAFYARSIIKYILFARCALFKYNIYKINNNDICIKLRSIFLIHIFGGRGGVV